MGLPRIDLLINTIREESDTEDVNSISDFIITEYMNDAQREIQRVIHGVEKSIDNFIGSQIITLTPNQLTYDLSEHQLADTSIRSVHTIDTNNRIIQTLRKIGYRERTTVFGYSIENQKIVLSSDPATGGGRRLLVKYNYRYPTLGLRWGKISSISGQDITLNSPLSDVENRSEYVTIVSKTGTQIARDLYVDSFSTPVLTVDGDITDATTDHYVTYGKNATTHCELPEDCLTYLKVFTARKIQAHLNSTKIQNTNVFTGEEREQIAELFTSKHSDVEYPMITDTDFLGY